MTDFNSPEPTKSTTEPAAKSPPRSLGCQPSLDEIYKYMDGLMDSQREAEVQKHFNHCHGCEDFYRFQTGLKRLVGKRCRTDLPATLSKRIFDAIAQQRPGPLG